MKKKDLSYKPIYFKDDSALNKPLWEVFEDLRTEISTTRGKLFDIKQMYGWNDRIEFLEGGLTCMLVAMYSTMDELKKFEEKFPTTK